jgi:hypothetical protein
VVKYLKITEDFTIIDDVRSSVVKGEEFGM